MKRRDVLFTLAACLGVLGGCAEESANEEAITVTFPHTVVIGAEKGLVTGTGEILPNANYKAADLVTYRSSGVKISSGCPVHAAECRPLHLCRPTIQSLPTKFDSLDEVCADEPDASETQPILEAEAHMGFTVRLNTREGLARFWIQSIEGTGASARLTLVYDMLE